MASPQLFRAAHKMANGDFLGRSKVGQRVRPNVARKRRRRSPCVAGDSTFEYTGAPQYFTVPAGVTEIIVDAYGAQGEGPGSPGTPGKGGYVRAGITVIPGEVLQFNVGGRPSGGGAGYNGGGAGGIVSGGSAPGGGGATDVRRSPYTLGQRLVVAGGGGGQAGSGVRTCHSGGGSYPSGQTATTDAGGGGSPVAATGGTQSAGGTAGSLFGDRIGQDGSSGQGGHGFPVAGSPNEGGLFAGGGGGGGGYYGGGGGGDGGAGGAGGGSSYFAPEAQPLAALPDTHEGHGRLLLTYDSCGEEVGPDERLLLWLDASETSTVLASGTSVDQWRDLSLYENHVVGSGAARPSYGTLTINGRPTVHFDSVDDLLSGTLGPFPSGAYTIWAVCVVVSQPGNRVPFFWQNTIFAAASDIFFQWRTGGIVRWSVSNSTLDTGGGQYSLGTAFLLKVTGPAVDASPGSIRTSGNAVVTGNMGSEDGDAVGGRVQLGATAGGGSLGADTAFGEIRVYAGEIVGAEADAIDAEFNAKWGVTA